MNFHHHGLFIYVLSVVVNAPLHIITNPAVTQHNDVVDLVVRNIIELINMHGIPSITVL